jgi:hypothetical protein
MLKEGQIVVFFQSLTASHGAQQMDIPAFDGTRLDVNFVGSNRAVQLPSGG